MKDDARLVEEYLQGSEDAVEELVRRYQRMIYAFAYRMVNNVEEAKDITQNTFIKAMRGISGFRGQSSFRTWLYRIALNTGLNYLREARHREVEMPESIPGRETGQLSAVIGQEERERLRQSLEKLPGQQKLAVMLRIYEGLSSRNASKVMGCSESAVKAHYHFGVRKLKEILSDLPGTQIRKESGS